MFIKYFSIIIIIIVPIFITEIFLRFQNFVDLNDFQREYPWNNILHHGTDEFSVSDYGSNCNGVKTKLLLLGDSWMEDGYMNRTIGQEFAAKSKSCVQVINGSTTSYSPTLYLLKARQAFDKFGKFDFIIVNIDETDVGDEWLRYQIPTVRNRQGEIISVPYEHDIHSRFLWNGEVWAKKSRFYLVRLIKFAFLHKVMTPLFYDFTFCPDYPSLMRYVFKPEAASLYKKEHGHFAERLEEMANEISTFTADPSFVYVTHHPHLRGLVDKVDHGPLYLPIVSGAIARLPEESGVTVLDARNHVRQIHGDTFPDNTFVAGDPYSHLTKDGAVRYGKWIASQIGSK